MYGYVCALGRSRGEGGATEGANTPSVLEKRLKHNLRAEEDGFAWRRSEPDEEDVVKGSVRRGEERRNWKREKGII